MATDGAHRAWLLMAAGADRGHAGNAGYDDQVDAYYSWDSLVPNHKNLRVGDVVALWNKRTLLGVSVIEEIEAGPGTKELQRCPNCGLTRIRRRRDGSWRCSRCGSTFPTPVAELADVTVYRARYDAAWTSLEGVLGAAELPALTDRPKSFNAIRELDWRRFSAALIGKDAERAVGRLAHRSPDLWWRPDTDVRVDFTHGHRHTLVRVRRGQAAFREHLLASQGETCAFTGGAPARVLEAGHLYSYARLGEHHQHGGLMLRRDIHRLFDDGMLAVDPDLLRVDVAADLERYPQYARLHGTTLSVPLRDTQLGWLGRHWDEHRGGIRVGV
ncbi:HNH endonuclease [Isoptericola sp. NPDC057653]|uniref:HNH endonuclease n=1 Tax=Isoptericola sp. NPDC057653 TaxID=3346195 RepID=UPI00368726E8